MKKAISIFIALGMIFSLVGCVKISTSTSGEAGKASDETTTKFDIGEAIIITPESLYSKSISNAAKVMQNTYVMNCQVGPVTSTFFYVKTLDNIRVFLPIEELAKLNVGDSIGIIGKVTNVYQEPRGIGYTDVIEMGEAMIYYNEAWSINE